MRQLVEGAPPPVNEQRADAAAPGLDSAIASPLALDQLLVQLRDRAGDVLATLGRLRGLLRANGVLASDLSLPSLLQSLVEEASDLLKAQYAAIVVMGANDRMDEIVQVGMPDSLLGRVQGHPSWREISNLLAPAVSEGGEATPEAQYGSAATDGPPPTDFLDLPVSVGKKVYGRLYLKKPTGAVFNDEDEQFVTALAATAGVALANASLFKESEQRHQWLVAASGLADDLLSIGTVRPLEVVCQYAMRAARADFATVTLPDQTSEDHAAAATGLLDEETLSHYAELRRDTEQTLRTGKPMLVNNYGDDDDPGEADVRIGSVMVVPLAAGDHTEGALTLGRVAGSTEFTQADVAMTAAFATQAAIAVAFNAARRTEFRMARLEDRDRIAMDLHDHVVQELFAVGMGLEGLAKGIDDLERKERIDGYVRSLNNTISTIRTRIFQLQPERHDPGGLQTQILELAEAQTEHLGFAPQLHFAGPIDSAVGGGLADDVLAVAGEALSNCAKHAEATAVTILLTARDGMLALTVTDNGKGIGSATRSSGLSHLARRAQRHAGTCTLTAPTTGGTRVTWTARL
jgi:signal transduction histidine kinase